MTTFTPLAPQDLGAYLRATGWKPLESRGKWRVFAKDVEGEQLELEVPTASSSSDYPRLVRRLLEDLASVEDRDVDIVERDVRSSAFDVVRVRLQGSLQNGRIPVEHGAHVFRATRDFLLAGACSALDPTRPMFSRKKPHAAMAYVRGAKFAPTEAGSFVLTVETAIPPKLKPAQADLFGRDEDEVASDGSAPFERNVGLRLESGTSRTRDLVDEIGADDSSDGLVAAIEHGVTSNLCDAIANLIEPEIAESVELAFRWSGLWPSPRPASRFVFQSATSPILRSMARSLRDAATIDGCRVFGPVRTLKSSDVDAGGAVGLVMMGDPARMRKVSMALDPASYAKAIQAHGEDKWFSCIGELIKVRGSFQLINARNAAVLSEDDDLTESPDESPF